MTFRQMMTPIWDTDTVYGESLTMIEDKATGITAAPLYFTPDRILSVTNAAGTVEYYRDSDWVLDGNRIVLTPRSRIFRFTEEEMYLPEPVKGRSFPDAQGRNSLFAEGHYFHDRQIAVTYEKSEKWDGVIPPCRCEDLPRTMGILERGEPLNLILFGDSISVGANASGFTVAEPFQPIWGNLVAEALRRHYRSNVKFRNPSEGGRKSDWGIENAKDMVAAYQPDTVIVAFGMNDRVPGPVFAEKIARILSIIREDSPETEFILCATTLPNQNLPGFKSYQGEYRAALETLCAPGVALVDFGEVQKQLLTRKRFIDMTGNNVNHPNDFLIRAHAHAMAAALIR